MTKKIVIKNNRIANRYIYLFVLLLLVTTEVQLQDITKKDVKNVEMCRDSLSLHAGFIPYMDSLRPLYERVKRKNADLSGRLYVSCTVHPDGRLSDITFSSSTFLYPFFADSVITHMKKWKLPGVNPSCSSLSLTLPISFAGEGEVIQVICTHIQASEDLNKPEKVFSRFLEDLRSTYLHTITFSKSFQGKLDMVFSVQKNSRVQLVDSLNTNLNDSAFVQTVLNLLGKYRYNKAAEMTISLNLVFQDLRGPYEVFLKEANPSLYKYNQLPAKSLTPDIKPPKVRVPPDL